MFSVQGLRLFLGSHRVIVGFMGPYEDYTGMNRCVHID